MKKFLIKAALFISISIAGMLLALSMLNPKWIEGRKKLYLEQSSIKSYDLLVMGSSRAEHVIDCRLFDTAKYKVFNIAEDGHGLVSNYLMLKVLLEKYKITAKRILLQVDESAFNGTVGFKSKFRDDFFVSDIKDTAVLYAFRKYKGASFAHALHCFPFLGDLIYGDFKQLPHLYNLSLRKGARKQFSRLLSIYDSTKGYDPLFPVEKFAVTEKQYSLEPDDVCYFEAFMELCKIHNIEIVLYRAPILDCHKIKSASFDQYIETYCDKNSIRFIDFKCAYPEKKEYKDQMHIADNAAKEITKAIIDALKMR